MNTLTAPRQQLVSARATRTLAAAIGLLLLLGLVWADSAEQLLGYLLVLCTAILPSLLWIRIGAPGIPVLPTVALAYIPYYAWPVLSNAESMLNYTLSEILSSALTVAAFLLVATMMWQIISGRIRATGAVAADHIDQPRVIRFVLVGLLAGVGYQFANSSGWLGSLGSYYGLVRTIASTFVTVACFLAGVTRALGLLRGKAFAVAAGAVCLLIVLSWSSLLMVGGIVYALAVAFGYVMVTRRVPWFALAAVLATVLVLHAGKPEMRMKYWAADTSTSTTLDSVPGLMAEWVAEGMSAIANGEAGQSVIERASMLQMVLLAQTATPGRVDFLMGETYSLLPAILVPRFIESDKPASQVGMDLLNIRYDILTVEGTTTTAIGWGLIAEAYANFGYFGVIGLAVILGACCGALALWSASSAALVSLPNLVSIATMMGLLNLELDFIQLASSLMQSYAVVFFFYTAFRWLAIR